MHSHGAKPQNCVLKFFCTKDSQSLLSLLGTREKNFSFQFKHYNLTIHVVKVFETICACSPSTLGQDLRVKISNFIYLFMFLLLELEMVDF